MSEKKQSILETAKERFKLAQEVEAAQRLREKDDLRFQVPEEQWDEVSKAERRGSMEGGHRVPARPMLSISKLDQPLQLIINQARAARLGVNIHPVSEDADKECAEVRQGLYRRIERDSNADQARLWALDRATKAGRGAYRVSTKYDEDSNPDGPGAFDQEIVIERILHQETVYFDPAATKADFSDGEFAFVVAWMSLSQFKREFPDAEMSKTDGQDKLEWESLETEAPDWVRTEGEERAVQVAEYWYKEHDYQEVKGPKGQVRKKDLVTVFVCKLNGTEVLTKDEWNGHYIPLVPVVGRELQPYDGERRWTGMIGPSKDGQKLYNFAASSLVERMASEPKTPWVMADGQAEGYQDLWQQANRRNFPVLFYKPTSVAGTLAPPPMRSQLDATGMNLAMMALQEADRFIQTTTSVYDPSLGRESARDKSGKAIVALQQQSDAGTSHFLASLADVSMPLEARIVLDLMPAIYDRPGRVTTILRGDDDKSEFVMLGAPYYTDPQTSRPVMMQPGQQPPMMGGQGGQAPMGPGMPPGGMAPMQGGPQQPPQPKVKEYNLKKGAYSVSVSIGKSFQTRLQQGAEFTASIIEASPDLLPMFGDLVFKFRDEPGADEISKRFAKLREEKFPGLGEGEDGEVPPEQLQAQLQSLQQQLKIKEEQMQMLVQKIETEQAKQQAALEKARMDNETKARIAEGDQRVAVLLQEMKNDIEEFKALLSAKAQQVNTAEEQRHAEMTGAEDRQHEAVMGELGREAPEKPEAPEPVTP